MAQLLGQLCDRGRDISVLLELVLELRDLRLRALDALQKPTINEHKADQNDAKFMYRSAATSSM